MNTPLQQAAQELIDRWDSPMWRYQQATTDVIAELRKALDAEITQSVEPYAVFQGLVDSGEHGAFNLDLLKMIPRGAYLYLHPPQPQATTPAVPTLKEALAQQGIKLRTEFEPKKRDSELATEQIGERAELIADLRGLIDLHTWAHVVVSRAAVMLEADAQHAKRVPMAGEEIEKIADGCRAGAGSVWPHAFARAIEAHHGITPTEKSTDWGQP